MTMAMTQLQTAGLRETAAGPAAIPIRAAGLTKTIESRVILQQIDLEVPHGSFVALLGANGAGKSTLLKILSTLNSASAGTLDLFGISAGTSAAKIRRHIGLIGHQTMLYHDLTA